MHVNICHTQLIIIFCLCVITIKVGCANFTHEAVLDSQGSFHLHWKYDDETVTFHLQAATKGWAGIGFSPNGGMAGADMVVIWIDQVGKAFISDRHADHNGFPSADEHQDYTLIESSRNETHLTATFSRKRNTCDPQDWVLTKDTTRIIYASNDAVPESSDKFQIHSVRGVKNIYLFESKRNVNETTLTDADVKYLDIRVNNLTVPNASTTYWCKIVRLPKVDKKVHYIKYFQAESLIDPGNLDIIHHIIVFMCTTNMSKYVGSGGPCFGSGGATKDEEDVLNSQCRQQFLVVWGKGCETITFPEFLGMPLYTDEGDRYVTLEIHYDNTQGKAAGRLDNSGIRLWTFEKLRPVEGGQATIGMPITPADHLIPPGQKEFTSYVYCSAQSTTALPKDGIKVFGGTLHSHLAGRKIRLLHFRHGKELPPIFSDDHYDFNSQDTRRLSEPVTVLPGDELVAECVYETLDRNRTTFGGISSLDEMCVVFVDFYPALYRALVCSSIMDKQGVYGKLFGIDVLPKSKSDQSEMVRMPNGGTKQLTKYLKQDFKFDWTPEKASQFQQAIRNARYDVACVKESLHVNASTGTTDIAVDISEQYGYPNVTEPYLKQNPCTDKKSGQSEIKNSGSEKHANVPSPVPFREHRDSAGVDIRNFGWTKFLGLLLLTHTLL